MVVGFLYGILKILLHTDYPTNRNTLPVWVYFMAW